MKTILVLLFPIVLIGCRNSLSDKEVDGVRDKTITKKYSGDSLMYTGDTITGRKIIETLLKNQDMLDKLCKELDKHLAGQNWKINPPNNALDSMISTLPAGDTSWPKYITEDSSYYYIYIDTSKLK